MSPVRRQFWVCCFFIAFASQIFGVSAYNRALSLRESDPIEAEALLEKFIHIGAGDKLVRAARHDLFYLRLSNNRLVEAYAQAKTKTFARKYREALALRFNMRQKTVARLMALYAQACNEGEVGDSLPAYLSGQKAGAAVYEFSIRVLEKCKIDDGSSLLQDEIISQPARDLRELALKLLVARYAIGEVGAAQQIVDSIEATDTVFLQESKPLAAQLQLLRARIAIVDADLVRAQENCNEIGGAGTRPAKDACQFLVAVGWANTGNFERGYKLISALALTPNQIDNRLARIALGVASGKIAPEKLKRFVRRASYHFCAPILRQLATNVLAKFP